MPIRAPSSESDGNPGSTASNAGGTLGPSWFGTLCSRLLIALGMKADPAGFVLSGSVDGARSGQDLLGKRLASRKKPDRRPALLNEAMALLDLADRRVILARLSGDDPYAVAHRLSVRPEEIGPLYAKAIDRLVERLTWVVDEEARGGSPPERRALGQVRFLGRSPQEVASLLRLPEEVVSRWIRQTDEPDRPGPLAPR